jgi:hypothetical protein
MLLKWIFMCQQQWLKAIIIVVSKQGLLEFVPQHDKFVSFDCFEQSAENFNRL